MHDAFWIFFELTSNYMYNLNNVKYNVNRSHGAQKQSDRSTIVIVFGLCTNLAATEEEKHHTILIPCYPVTCFPVTLLRCYAVTLLP